MSYEKINELIKQAPEVSQWWVSNKRALNFWFLGFEAMNFIFYALGILGASVGSLLCVGVAFNQVSVSNLWPLLVIAFLCGLGHGWFKFAPKWWSKRFTYNNFRLTEKSSDETASLDFTHEILSQAVNLHDLQMKPILARLRALKDTDLPKCWWEALACEMDKCIVAQNPSVNKSVQEKLDAMYVQMEDVSVTPSITKVLRL